MIITIRRAGIKDSAAMADLDKKCFPSPWSESAFREELFSNQNSFYLLAIYEEKVIGYGGLWEIVGEGHITNFAVDPDFRKKGIGYSLLKELIDQTEKRGINSHTLEVRVSNKEAISLYEKFGFKIGGLRKEYYSDNLEDALILWRTK